MTNWKGYVALINCDSCWGKKSGGKMSRITRKKVHLFAISPLKLCFPLKSIDFKFSNYTCQSHIVQSLDFLLQLVGKSWISKSFWNHIGKKERTIKMIFLYIPGLLCRWKPECCGWCLRSSYKCKEIHVLVPPLSMKPDGLSWSSYSLLALKVSGFATSQLIATPLITSYANSVFL